MYIARIPSKRSGTPEMRGNFVWRSPLLLFWDSIRASRFSFGAKLKSRIGSIGTRSNLSRELSLYMRKVLTLTPLAGRFRAVILSVRNPHGLYCGGIFESKWRIQGTHLLVARGRERTSRGDWD